MLKRIIELSINNKFFVLLARSPLSASAVGRC